MYRLSAIESMTRSIGCLQVFLKEAAVELLQTATEIRAAILLQTAIRGRRIRRGYARMKEQRRRQEEEEAEQRRRADLSQSSTQKVCYKVRCWIYCGVCSKIRQACV